MITLDIRPAIAPDGRSLVLIQLPDGFVLLAPDDARWVAALIVEAADAIERAG